MGLTIANNGHDYRFPDVAIELGRGGGAGIGAIFLYVRSIPALPLL